MDEAEATTEKLEQVDGSGSESSHRVVQRLENPQHCLAPSGTEVYFKYGDEHYPESTVPEEFSLTDDNAHVCRYITNFLVYNKRGERLLPIETLNAPRAPSLSLYGQLLSTSTLRSGTRLRSINYPSKARKKHWQLLGRDAPYPVRLEVAKWQIEYGPDPQDRPAIWLVSSTDAYYRLEQPAGRYKSVFASFKRKFDVCARILKTLQLQPLTSLQELCDLTCYGTRDRGRALLIAEAQARANAERLAAEGGTESEHWTEGQEHLEQPQAQHAVSYQYREQLRKLLAHSEEISPWGAGYRVRPSLETFNVFELGDFIKSQASFFADHYQIDLLATPAMQQLGASTHRAQQPHSSGSPETNYVPPQYSPASAPAASTMMVNMPSPYMPAGPADYGSPGPAVGYDSFQMAASGFQPAPMYPRIWMRTALHVFDAKPIPNYWTMSPSEQLRRPYFLGQDWLWGSAVCTGTQTGDPDPPLPQEIPILLPERQPLDRMPLPPAYHSVPMQQQQD